MPGDGERAAAGLSSGNLLDGDVLPISESSVGGEDAGITLIEMGFIQTDDASSRIPVSGDLAPGDLALGDLAPGDLAPGDLALGDLAPGDLASGGLASGGFTPESERDGSGPPDVAVSASSVCSSVSSSFSPGSVSSMTSQDSFTGLIDETETGITPEAALGVGSDLDHELRVVTARGTEHGLVLRIDGKADWTLVRGELDHFLGGRRKFFEGGEVSIEWIDRLPTPEQGRELGEYLLKQYGLTVVTRRRRIAQGNSISGVPPHAPVAPNAASSGLVPGSGPLGQAYPVGQAYPGQNTGAVSSSFGSPEFSSQNIGSANMNKAPGELQFSNSFSEDGLEHMPAGSLPGARGGVTINLFPQSHSGATSSNQGTSGGLGEEGLPNDEELFVSGVVQSTRGYEGSRGASQGTSRMMFDDEGGMFSSPSSASSISPRRVASQMAKMLGGPDLFYEDDANAKILFGTLRSGQRVETPFSLIVVGDVNPGADLVAGGDIVVLGSLRGTAHASAYDDDSFDRVIIALQMQPMQLRIGSVLSRGSEEVVRGAEIARIENRRIVVEAFNPRMLWGRKTR